MAEPSNTPDTTTHPLPRVTIQFCTQCKWLLRAAYVSPPSLSGTDPNQHVGSTHTHVLTNPQFAQELLSTFSTDLGEVALQPTTGGIFVVEIVTAPPSPDENRSGSPAPALQRRILWDRKADGGFPETKELKRRVRDVIQPGRNLGHVDLDYQPQGKGDADAAGKATATAKKHNTTGGSCSVEGPGKCNDCE